MCGFVSIISKNGKPVSKESLKAMSREIIHRGPDDSGTWLSDWCGLAFRRLSIMDVSDQGHQPMSDSSGEYVIVFNGEVYNFKEIRLELEEAGVAFRSGSDTEVVLQSYIRWGEKCVERFTGMFSLIIVEKRIRRIFIARDHLGIKPLYTYEDDDFFYFSSEIKALRHVTRFKVNYDSLFEQLIYRYVAGNNTPFKEIHKLSAGTYRLIEQGQFKKDEIYYDIAEKLQVKSRVQEIGILPKIESALKDSIQLHTRSDVGYNIQLSGGVDSSFITAVLSEVECKRLDTFSITLDDEGCNEEKFQNIVATRYRTKHHAYRLTANSFSEALEKAAWHMDVPIVHLGCIFLMLLCQHSVKNSKVILTGEGADELFGGYSRYMLGKKDQITNTIQRLKIQGHFLPNISPFKGLKSRLSKKIIEKQLSTSKDSMLPFLDNLEENTRFRDRTGDALTDTVDKMLAHDQKCYLESLLDRQDKMSMAVSVESRVPFCNPRLFDMVNPISNKLKLKNNIPKYLLKKLSEPYLDNSILYRRKNGLKLPLDQWLRNGPLKDRLSVLTDDTARQRGIYHYATLTKAVDRHIAGKENHGKQLMTLMMFETWMRIFIDRQGERPY